MIRVAFAGGALLHAVGMREAVDADASFTASPAAPQASAQVAACKLVTADELDALDAAARRHLADPDTLTVPVTYFLAWARKPQLEPRR